MMNPVVFRFFKSNCTNRAMTGFIKTNMIFIKERLICCNSFLITENHAYFFKYGHYSVISIRSEKPELNIKLPTYYYSYKKKFK